MALQTKVIKQKIASVGNVQKVTKTMELISVAKMRKAVERKRNAKHYGQYILEILVRIAAQRHLEHPLFKARDTGTRMLVLMTSDRGLCGQFHARIDKRVRQFLENHQGAPIVCVAVGSYALRIAKRYKLEVIYTTAGATENLTVEDMHDLSAFIIDAYSKDTTYHSVSCIFNQFENAMAYGPTRSKIIPLNEELLAEVFEKDRYEMVLHSREHQYTLEPDQEEVLHEILPELIALTLHKFLLHSSAAEHSARMVAMRRASDNASRLKQKLVRDYNRARQEAVTKEIIEIVSAAEAL
jgi:F-type H+-transporting ATPase subunit gamma